MTPPAPHALPPTDRELMLLAQEEHDAAASAMAQVQQGRIAGLRAAAMVYGMWEGLGTEDKGLTRGEKLALIQAALRGR